jgi:hypothetical protein
LATNDRGSCEEPPAVLPVDASSRKFNQTLIARKQLLSASERLEGIIPFAAARPVQFARKLQSLVAEVASLAGRGVDENISR